MPRVVCFRVQSDEGKPVKNLGASDFVWRCDGQRCAPDTFVADSPVRLVLLIDRTGSMHVQDSVVGREVDQALSAASRDATRIGVVASGVSLAPGFSDGLQALRQDWMHLNRFDNSSRFGASPIWDAVYDGDLALEGQLGPRAVVLYTDGKATGNVHSRSEALERSLDAGVVVSVLIESGWQSGDTAGLIELAERTSGDWQVREGRDGTTALSDLIRKLHPVYCATFDQPPASVVVTPNQANLTVRAFRPYTASTTASR